MNYVEYAPLFKVLADETRLRIIDRLSREELCACHLLEEFHITQPTLSYHMKLLTGCGLVEARKEGIWMRYKLNACKSKECQCFINALLGNNNTH
ncbi:MAG: ArsR/SmtB family transcription factor [Cellulosilyticaceae bacterium]